MVTRPSVALLYWGANTLNTPFKAGITNSAEGMALVSGAYGGWQVVLAIPRGETNLFIHSTNDGVPTGWKKLASI